jgi:hypothetical protein
MKEENRRPYKISLSNRPLMLDVRATVREFVALPYTYLEMVQYNPSDGILLTFATCEVRITGCKLDDLYTGFVQHMVEFVQENDAKYEQGADTAPFVSRIEIKPLGKEVEMIVKGFDPEREALAEKQTEE